MSIDADEALKRAIDSELLAAGLNRAHVADHLEMDLSTLGNHLRGKSPLTVAELRGIAEVLDMTPQEILDRADHILGREQRRAVTQSAGDGAAQAGGDIIVGGGLGIN